MLGLHKDKVEIHSYTSEWAEEFKKEKAILKKLMGKYALSIEHVGSTSIPGLSAKPILDMAVGVKDISILRELIPFMNEHGYDILDSIEDKEEILGRKGTPDMRTHYIHIMVNDSERMKNQLLFRDYLIKNPQYIKEYENLKKDLSTKFKDDRLKYTAAKNDFIQKILTLAKSA